MVEKSQETIFNHKQKQEQLSTQLSIMKQYNQQLINFISL